MRSIILFNMVTLDGFFADANGQIDWHRVDDEFDDYAVDQLKTADGLIFGRVTYELMASYWPTAAAAENDPVIAGRMNMLPKIVASRTLQTVAWNNTRLIKNKCRGGDRPSQATAGWGSLYIWQRESFVRPDSSRCNRRVQANGHPVGTGQRHSSVSGYHPNAASQPCSGQDLPQWEYSLDLSTRQ
jgi:hypothetical protein